MKLGTHNLLHRSRIQIQQRVRKISTDHQQRRPQKVSTSRPSKEDPPKKRAHSPPLGLRGQNQRTPLDPDKQLQSLSQFRFPRFFSRSDVNLNSESGREERSGRRVSVAFKATGSRGGRKGTTNQREERKSTIKPVHKGIESLPVGYESMFLPRPAPNQLPPPLLSSPFRSNKTELTTAHLPTFRILQTTIPTTCAPSLPPYAATSAANEAAAVRPPLNPCARRER